MSPPNLASLLLQYARLDRKRGLEGLDAAETEQLTRLDRELSDALTPHIPPGAERRSSIRVPADVACRWAPMMRPENGRITVLSRAGAFIRTPAPAPVGQKITIAITLPSGGAIEVPGVVANQILGPDPERQGMGVRFARMPREVMAAIDALYELSIVRQFGTPEPPPSDGGTPTSG